MFSPLQISKKYLHYYVTALNGKGHGMHSPFLFQFILNVLNNKQDYTAPEEIETVRRELLSNNTKLLIEDLGAGSRTAKAKERTVRQVAASAVKSKKYSQVLYRLARYYQPKNIIELGTSLGITTIYFAKAVPSAQVTTIEGSEAIRREAVKNFERLAVSNVESLQGNFDDVLPLVLNKLDSIDLAYVDGNHRYEPTVRYFRQIVEKAHNDTILVFDDIHWSAEMERAWMEIKSDPSVRCTVDLFFLGLVFFRGEFKEPQHFSIRF